MFLAFHLNGCENWTFTLKEEQWVRIMENGVLRKKFDYKTRKEKPGEN
jgi:hypothetical protein